MTFPVVPCLPLRRPAHFIVMRKVILVGALIGAVVVMLHGSMFSIPLALVGAAFLRGWTTSPRAS